MTANIYTAAYSGVPVYEMMCRGIAVMRRRDDSSLNATQILKVAGIEKGRRTKILEREVLTGEHEKVQGGYGKYQGTWVPFQRGKDLARQYRVDHLLQPLFEYAFQLGEVDTITPTKEMAQMAQKNRDGLKASHKASPRMSPMSKRARSTSVKLPGSHAPSMTPSPMHPSFNTSSPSMPPSPQWHSDLHPRKRNRPSSPPGYDHVYAPDGDLIMDYHHSRHILAEPVEGVEKYRSILMTIFLTDDTEHVPIPDLLTNPATPTDLDIDLVIDDQGHTALHWAAALARVPVMELLVQKNADIRRVNYNGESCLVRAVLVTNNFDRQTFPHLLNVLHKAIPIVDRNNRTLLHHIAITCGIRGRSAASHYYMECLLEWIARNGGDFSAIIDIQDKNGDTALTIAARVGDRYISKFLIDVGANRDLENKVGLKAEDFGIDDGQFETGDQPFVPRRHVPAPENTAKETPTKRGKEIMSVVQKMVDELDVEFSHEILARHGQLEDTQTQLRNATRALTETRKTIQDFKTQAQQLEEAQQKIKNLEFSLEEESQRTRNQNGYSTKLRNNNEDIDLLFNVRAGAGAGDMSREKIAELEVIHLRSRVLAYQKVQEELTQELAEAKSKSSANELLCKRVISICCSIPLESVDDMLVPLTLAVESEGAGLDLSRVAGFMSRVKQQEGMASANTAPPSSLKAAAAAAASASVAASAAGPASAL
ncbi:regulatory protein SWI6 [Entomortierella parvispora]|uniref:Regulatory protein SWI6 n=1 Tax=Entomortierella parvispora TaxID=205924 RepID=A0A9P3M1U8_9FUNG|nr:regulatory protein SWI6 [Entomortierella parvispora]